LSRVSGIEITPLISISKARRPMHRAPKVSVVRGQSVNRRAAFLGVARIILQGVAVTPHPSRSLSACGFSITIAANRLLFSRL
jgi:hypothetical protein